MNKIINLKIVIIGLISIFFIFGITLKTNRNFVYPNNIYAEEDEKEEEHEEEYDDDYNSNKDVIKYETETITITEEIPVTEELETVQVLTIDPSFKKDTDGDKLVDAIDPHPEASELLYFTDTDEDGVADAYDKYSDEDDFYYMTYTDENENGISDYFEHK
jgi:hypothetical protein